MIIVGSLAKVIQKKLIEKYYWDFSREYYNRRESVFKKYNLKWNTGWGYAETYKSLITKSNKELKEIYKELFL